ncbi:hypothetical protein SUGI_1226000 [Cryptomeria japonica]|uniref:Uncharacterized protein n=1 Tax=Cryptomeria japonica TaxID=3369 RepID=A0AAD3NPX0_CRYJA|nr:hypothetical protein SUGI_1226000 [Cryptomeria japonica]
MPTVSVRVVLAHHTCTDEMGGETLAGSSSPSRRLERPIARTAPPHQLEQQIHVQRRVTPRTARTYSSSNSYRSRAQSEPIPGRATGTTPTVITGGQPHTLLHHQPTKGVIRQHTPVGLPLTADIP